MSFVHGEEDTRVAKNQLVLVKEDNRDVIKSASVRLLKKMNFVSPAFFVLVDPID